VAEVVSEADGFDKVLVESQSARDGSRDLCHLESVREPDSVVVALGGQEDLRLVREPAKGFGMHNAVPVALIAGPDVVIGLDDITALGRGRELSALGQRDLLDFLGSLSICGCHGSNGSRRLRRALTFFLTRGCA
jgi:hypothetical protein